MFNFFDLSIVNDHILCHKISSQKLELGKLWNIVAEELLSNVLQAN
jgi:hypothetical protein